MNLYIDFDGVILDTIPVLYDLLTENNINKKDEEKVSEFISRLDWKKIIRSTPQINNSVNTIKKLMEIKYFNIAILTHVSSLEEAIEKIIYIEELIPDVTIIPVPKKISKTKMVHTKGSVLVDDYEKNLIEWEKEGGISILFSRKEENSKYQVINHLEQLIEIFDKKI